mgnify:CR=1 FL=1
MAELKIKVPNVAHIVITGPAQCGKSIVMDRIEKALKLKEACKAEEVIVVSIVFSLLT